MAHQTHYEVHVKHNGRWEIHARHPATEKELAIEEAKAQFAMKHIQDVKVIQEIFNPDEGLAKEYNVYTPGQAPRIPRKSTSKSPAQKAKEAKEAEADGVDEEDINWKKKKKPKRSLNQILLRMGGIIAFSIIVGTMFTWFTSMVMAESTIAGNARSNILFIVFLVVFVIAAIPMAMVFLGKESDD